MPLLADIWNNGNVLPPVGPPTIGNVPCALVLGDRVALFTVNVYGPQNNVLHYILVPKLTNVWDAHNLGGPSVVCCPRLSNRFYVVVDVDDVGKGYSNEYRQLTVIKGGVWPTPIP